MTADQMRNEIKDYCFNIIINSKVQDWNIINKHYIKDNILIYISNNPNLEYFKVKIYKEVREGYFCHEVSTISFVDNVKFWSSSQEKKRNKLLKNKYFEIKKYFDNKQEYDAALETYKLLPISVLRKNKLKALDKK